MPMMIMLLSRIFRIIIYKMRLTRIVLFLFILIMSSVVPRIVYSEEVIINIKEFEFDPKGLKISVNLENTLPKDRPDISGERIQYIDKGTEVKLIFRISLHKKGWWLFNNIVSIGGKNELVVTRTLEKDVITKIYTVKEYANVPDIVGLMDETEFNGSILDKEIFKKEKLKKLRNDFFEKEMHIIIGYDMLNLGKGESYYIESKGEYHSYEPIFGTGEPRNFFTSLSTSIEKIFDLINHIRAILRKKFF